MRAIQDLFSFRLSSPMTKRTTRKTLPHSLLPLESKAESPPPSPADYELPLSYLCNPNNYSDSSSERSAAAAELRRGATFICDLGCGKRKLEEMLPGAIYLPADVEQWTPAVELCDFNSHAYPEKHLAISELTYVLGVLEYLRDVPTFLSNLAVRTERVVLSYNITDDVQVDRLSHHWLNAFTLSELMEMADRAGFQKQAVRDLRGDYPQILLSLRSTHFSAADLAERDARRNRLRAVFAPAPPMARVIPRDSSKPLLVLHLPKTAGTALQQALRDGLKPTNEVFRHAGMSFGAFQRFETLDPEIQGIVARSASDLPTGGDLVSGHLPLSFFRERYPEGQIIAIFREPMTRVLSHWMFLRSLDDAQLSRWGGWAETLRVAKGNLSTFLSDTRLAAASDNVYIRYLLWPHAAIPSEGFIDPAHDEALVVAALSALDSLCFYDMVEHPHFVERLQSWLCAPVSMPHANEVADIAPEYRQPLADHLSGHGTALLTSRTRLDARLWRAAVERIGLNPEQLRGTSLLRTLPRYAELLSQ